MEKVLGDDYVELELFDGLMMRWKREHICGLQYPGAGFQPSADAPINPTGPTITVRFEAGRSGAGAEGVRVPDTPKNRAALNLPLFGEGAFRP